MKNHIPLLIALATIVVTGLLAAFTLHVVGMRPDPNVHLPIARPEDPSRKVTITLKPGGAAYSGDTELSDASLGQFLSAHAGKELIIQTTAGVKYEEIKPLLGKLKAFGVDHVTFKTSQP